MKTKNRKRKVIKGLIIQICIGITLGIFIGIILSDIIKIDSIKSLFLFFLYLYISLFIVVNIHELGHLFFGKIFGFELVSYRVGIFTWSKENSKMKFSIIRNKGYGGLCAMIPPDKDLHIYKYLLYYSGGIIFNLLTGLTFTLLVYLHPNIPVFIKLLSFTSIYLGCLNLIPILFGNNPSDGKVIWSIILKKPVAKKLIFINKMIARLSSGTRPRDIELSVPIDIDNIEGYDFFILLYSYFKALDDNDSEKMIEYAKILEENINKFPFQNLPGVYNELCYMGCIVNDIEKAKTYYNKAGKILKKDNDVNGLRIKAYYEYFINKDVTKALDYIENGLNVADKFPIKGQALLEIDLINSLKEMISRKSLLDIIVE